jgi:hypothetical protein
MMAATDINSTGRSLSVRVPLALAKRGGRKVILAPDGSQPALGVREYRAATALVKALAHAFRWRRMIETGRFVTFGDLSRAEKVSPSNGARPTSQPDGRAPSEGWRSMSKWGRKPPL